MFFYTSYADAQDELTTSRSDIRIRRERIQLVDGDSLLDYNVIVGTFGHKPNAKTLQNKLINMGYNARIAKNSSLMYRVIAGSFANKSAAVEQKIKLEDIYPDSWVLLLYREPETR